MLKYIPSLAMLNRYIFFSFMGLLGIHHSSESNSLAIFSVGIFILNLVLYFRDVIKENKVRYIELVFIAVPFLYVISTLITISKYGYVNNYTLDSLIYFIVWGASSIFAALYTVRNNGLPYIIKITDIIILLFTLSSIKNIIFPFLTGVSFETVGGETYQTASYISALTIGLSIYLLLHRNELNLFRLFKTKKYLIVRLVIILINFLSIFVTGGRGGFVLVVAYFLYFFLLSNSSVKEFFKKSLSVIILVGTLISLSPFLLDNQIIRNGFLRITQFIGENGGIDWSGTSGRDIVYGNSLEVISRSIYFGHGSGASYYEMLAYPHNLFLELLIEGGIIYLFLAIFIFILFFMKLNKLIALNNEYKYLMVLSIFMFTLLMFSGSYMRMDTFWFVITCVFALNRTNIAK